jgi:hypothetical protein
MRRKRRRNRSRRREGLGREKNTDRLNFLACLRVRDEALVQKG